MSDDAARAGKLIYTQLFDAPLPMRKFRPVLRASRRGMASSGPGLACMWQSSKPRGPAAGDSR